MNRTLHSAKLKPMLVHIHTKARQKKWKKAFLNKVDTEIPGRKICFLKNSSSVFHWQCPDTLEWCHQYKEVLKDSYGKLITSWSVLQDVFPWNNGDQQQNLLEAHSSGRLWLPQEFIYTSLQRHSPADYMSLSRDLDTQTLTSPTSWTVVVYRCTCGFFPCPAIKVRQVMQ